MKLRGLAGWRRRRVLGAVAALVVLCVPMLAAAAAKDDVAAAPVLQSGSYLAGRFAQHMDDLKAAATYMGDALAHDPGDVGLLRRTFLLELGYGRFDAALPLARRLVAVEPGSPFALLLLFADDAAAGRLDAAGSRLAVMAPDGVAKYARPLLAGWLAQAEGKPRTAVEEALAPLATLEGLGAVYALHMALIADVGGDRETADRWYVEALRGSPGTLRVVQSAGSFLARTGKADQARALYADFAKDNGASGGDGGLLDSAALIEQADLGAVPAVVTARDGMAESLFDLASALQQESSGEMAMIYARISLLLRPDFPLAQLLVGDGMANRNHFDDALAQYQEIARDGTLGWGARLRMAETLARLERTADAAAILEKLAAEYPDRADALVHLGDLYRGSKRYAEAIKAYDRAVERIPQLDERHWIVLYGRAACYERTGPWEMSEKDLLAALKFSKDQAILLNFLGYSWVDKGLNLAQARSMIERAVALRPKDGYIIDSLGWALFRIGDNNGAVMQLERAIELKPADPTINDHLGDAYWAVGRRTEAVFQWHRALQNSDELELTESVGKKLKERAPPHSSSGGL
ncbi:MAG: tetratricopeptide repeat protein [Rhodospirillaceae bacterium]